MATEREDAVAEHPPEFPQLCRYLAERSPQPMVAVEGLTHIVRYVNPAFCSLSGALAAKLVGHPFGLAVPEGLANHCAEMLARIFATGQPEVLVEQEHSSGAGLGERNGASWSYLGWAILGPAEGGGEKPVGVMIQVSNTTEAADFRRRSVAVNSALLESGVRQHELRAKAERLSVELRESGRRVNSVLDSMPQTVFTAKPSGDLDYFNPQWSEFTGFTLEQLKSGGWAQCIHPDDMIASLRAWQHSIDSGEPFQIEHRFRRADGEYRWQISRAVALWDHEGLIEMWIGSNTDIEDLKQAEDALRQSEGRLSGQKQAFEAAVNGATLEASLQFLARTATEQSGAGSRAAFFVVDADGTCLHPVTGASSMSEAYCRVVDGFPIGPNSPSCGLASYVKRAVIVRDVDEDPLWTPWLSLAREHGIRACWSFPILTLAGKVVGTLAIYHTQPCEPGPRELELASVLTQAAGIIISRDTEAQERRRAEEALRRSEAKEREARVEAEQANQSKDTFLATLSHELRTPLSAVLGWTMVLRACGKPLDKDVSDGLAVIERNARAQAKLIEEVLDVARITSGKFLLDTRPLDLKALVLGVMDTLRPSADAKQLTLAMVGNTDGPGNPWVLGDELRLQQVMSNLLSNAIKFTPSSGRVSVSVERGKGLTADEARVTISDTGKGIEAKFLPHIFERFMQAGAVTTRSYGGLGLGLSIVKYIVEAHGGTARAQSAGEGRGATFTLMLPALADAAAPLDTSVPTGTARVSRLDGLRVLVVDDEEDSRRLAGRALESAGAIVSLAASAEEGYRLAIETAEDARPQVLVSDIGMAGEDGYSLMRRVRARKFAADLPALAMTAFAAPEDKRRALLAGFQVHLPKPVNPHELIEAVAGLAGRTSV